MNQQHYKILLIEDSEDDYIAVQAMLATIPEAQFEVIWISNYEEAVTCLTCGSKSLPSGVTCHYDACLLDYHLGKQTGLDVLRAIRSKQQQYPIILLTGEKNPEIDRQALELGAAGFLGKDEISPKSLERTLHYTIRQQQAAMRLQMSHQNLEHQMAQQSIELERIRQREEYLRQLQTRLLSSVSHEFRTPLMMIQSSAELLEEFPSDAETQSSHFERIYQGVELITKNLDNALVYAALEAGEISCNPIPIHLASICVGLTSNLQQLVDQQQRLQFVNHCNPSTTVHLDVGLLNLILTHLLLNAIRYAPKSDTIQVELDCSQTATGEVGVILQVKDQGIGIPSDELDQVFDAYYRASNASSIPGTPGIGMGLAIVKRATELQGGRVELNSTVGQGTQATVYLPCITVCSYS